MRAALFALVSFAFLVPLAGASRAAEQDVLRARLSNGLRVVIVRDPLAPVASEIINYLAGGQDTPAGFPGTAHAVEHMVAGRSSDELSEDQIATMTALMGGADNADTQTAVTQYYTTVPAKDLGIALRIEAARMRGAKFSQAEWLQERGAIEQEVSADNSDAFTRYYEKATALVFAGTPYDHTSLGTRPSFQKTDAALLKHFYQRWYAPNNAILVITGDVDPAQMLSEVKSIFGAIPERPVPAHAPVKLRPLPASQVIHDISDSAVPIALLTYRMPGFRSPDYAAAEIAIDVLQSQRGALAALGYEGKALNASVAFEPAPEAGLAFAYVASAPGSDSSAALNLLGGVIAAYQKNGVPADLVEAAKQREIAAALFSRDSIEGLAEDWSDAVAVQGLNSPDDILARFGKVTVADVNRILRTYMVRERAVAGVLTPKPGGVPSSRDSLGVHDTFGRGESMKPVPLPSWAATLDVLPEVPVSRLSPSDTTLPNGIRLIVLPETISPTVTVVGRIRHNSALQAPPGKEGVEDVLSGLFDYGTTTYDRVAYQVQLDAIAADVSAGTAFGLDVPSKSFERGMQLLADDLLHPALPADAFAIAQRQTVQALQGEMTTPDYLASRALQTALLPKGDAALRQATPATVGALSLDDVKAYYATVFRPDMTTIVVAGDTTPERAQALVQQYFGAWTASGPKPDVQLPPVPLNAAATLDVTAPGRTQASVSLEEELGLTRSNPDYYALQLGDTILGGAFYASRFSRDLRQQAGLVYSIGAQVQAGKTRAVYGVRFGSDPDKVAAARAIVTRDLHELATTPPSASELKQAQLQMLRDLELSEASVSDIASGLVQRADAEQPLDEPTRRAHAIVELTPAQVSAAFAKWIDPARFVEVVQGPAAGSPAK